jgi:methyl-accepting chemotaxis protein
MSLVPVRLGPRLVSIIAFLGMIIVALAGLGIAALNHYDAAVGDIRDAAARAVVSQRINTSLMAVVAESRGIYAAKSPTEIDNFAKPLLADLDDLTALTASWLKLARGSDRAAIQDAANKLEDTIRMRRDTVRIGREQGGAAAEKATLAPGVREARQALNDRIGQLTLQSQQELVTIGAGMGDVYQRSLWFIVGVGVIGLVVGAGTSVWLVTSGIIRPIQGLTRAMTELAGGKGDASVPATGRADEIGAMARTVVVFRDSMREAERLRGEQEAVRVEAERSIRDAIRGMADTVETATHRAVEQVARKTITMSRIAAELSGSADKVSDSAHEVAQAAERALDNAEIAAAATSKLSAGRQDIAEQVALASSVTRQAVADGENTQRTVLSLRDNVAKIGDVARLIGQIAEQTNLLALNATIEAARAGDAGRGFAVVATEVKNLATQTAQATGDIARQIGEIQAVTQATVTAAGNIILAIGRIDEIASTIASAVDGLGGETHEIARNVSETAAAARRVSDQIARVSDETTLTGTSAKSVNSVASELAGDIDDLQQMLVRAVRTSTDMLDRRQHPRFKLPWNGRLELASGSRVVAVEDISAGGGRIADCAGLVTGTTGQLRLDPIGRTLAIVVIAVHDDVAQLRFAIDETERESLAKSLADLGLPALSEQRPLAA